MAKEQPKAAKAPDEEVTQQVSVNEIGTLDGDFVEASANENMPTFVPGKNWKQGEVLGGTYVRTDRVYSEKFTAGKKDPVTKKKYRDLHVLEAKDTKLFGIWSVGVLGNFFTQVPANAPVRIEYAGIGDKPFKEGDNAPHTFKTSLGAGYRLNRRAGGAMTVHTGASV